MCGLTMKLSHFWNIKKSLCDCSGPSGAVGQQVVVYLDTCRKSCKEGLNQLCSGSVSCFSTAVASGVRLLLQSDCRTHKLHDGKEYNPQH